MLTTIILGGSVLLIIVLACLALGVYADWQADEADKQRLLESLHAVARVEDAIGRDGER